MTAYLTSTERKNRRYRASVEKRYRIKLPTAVVALDYGSRGDLYIRFEHAEKPAGEPTNDGLAVFFYDDGNRLAALEILNFGRFNSLL
jgi:hypothetical protein